MMNLPQRELLDTVQFSDYIASFADPAREILAVEPYTYSVDASGLTLTNAATQDFNVPMDSDSDFVLTFMSGAAIINQPAIVAPANANRVTEFAAALLIQITNQASGKTFFNVPTPLGLIAGAAGLPYILSSPRIIRPRTTLTISAVAAAANVTFSAFMFSMHGGKIYYSGRTR